MGRRAGAGFLLALEVAGCACLPGRRASNPSADALLALEEDGPCAVLLALEQGRDAGKPTRFERSCLPWRKSGPCVLP